MRFTAPNDFRTMILVIGANSPIGLTVIRELGERGVPVLAHGTTPRALGRYSRHSRAFVCEPGPLAEWLPRVAPEHEYHVVVPSAAVPPALAADAQARRAAAGMAAIQVGHGCLAEILHR